MDDDTWFEEEYEIEFVGRMPNGWEMHRFKTPEEFDAEVPAMKARKVVAKKKKDDEAAEKAAVKAAKATVAQQPPGNLKRKRVAPVKTSKGEAVPCVPFTKKYSHSSFSIHIEHVKKISVSLVSCTFHQLPGLLSASRHGPT